MLYFRFTDPILKITLFILVFFAVSICGYSQKNQKVEKLLNELNTVQRDTHQVSIYNQLSTELMEIDANQAKKYALKGLVLSKELNQAYHISWSYNLLGLSFDYLGNADSALFYYFRSIDVKKNIKDTDGIGSVYLNIGVLYAFQSDYKNAIRYYELALRQYRFSGNKKGVGAVWNNLGSIYRQQKKYMDAIESYQSALALKMEVNDTAGMSRAYSNLGLVFQYMGEYEKAEKFHFMSMRLDSLTSNNYNLVSSFISLAQLYVYLEKPDLVMKTLDTGIALGKRLQAIHYLDDAYKTYAHFDSIQGDFKSAFEHINLYFYYHDLVKNEDRLTQLDRMEIVFQTKEKEKEIELLNTKSQLDTYRLEDQERKLFYTLLVTILLVLLILTGIFALLNIRKRKMELQRKNEIILQSLEEKEALLKELHHRVKNNLQVVSSLLSVQSRTIEDEKARDAVKEGKNRVNAMAMIHQELYNQKDFRSLNAKEYIEQLSGHLFSSYSLNENRVELIREIEDISLDIEMMIPLGLILNEAISNSLKYAFHQRPGKLQVKLKKQEGFIYLSVSDNGDGFDVPEDWNKVKSLGLRLIKMFSEKLKAEMLMRSDNGFTLQLKIPFK